jgi:hypothetical protein
MSQLIDPDAREREEKVKELRDRRIGKDACCGTCRFAYPSPPDALGEQGLQCKHSPPWPVYAVGVQGNAISAVVLGPHLLKAVHPDNFCAQWAPDQIDLQ